MVIHSASDPRPRTALCGDYFYNYFSRGIDILFDGQVRRLYLMFSLLHLHQSLCWNGLLWLGTNFIGELYLLDCVVMTLWSPYHRSQGSWWVLDELKSLLQIFILFTSVDDLVGFLALPAMSMYSRFFGSGLNCHQWSLLVWNVLSIVEG